jgi:hypothetical protein
MSGSLATVGNGSGGEMRAINAFAGTLSTGLSIRMPTAIGYTLTPLLLGGQQGVAFINIEMGGSFFRFNL